jgi:hypothetical protein
MHGLISKSSFVDWQDQPDFNHSVRTEVLRAVIRFIVPFGCRFEGPRTFAATLPVLLATC